MPDFGGRALPAVSVSVGQSKQQIQGIIDSLRGMEQMLDEVRRSAQQTAQAVNGIKAPKAAGGGGRGRGGGAGGGDTATMDRQIARQRQQLDAADQRQRRAASDAEYRRTRTRQRSLDQELNRRFSERLGGGAAAEGAEGKSVLGRVVNAAGWAPGMPSQMYLAQMALGEMGLGLSLPLVAGGMGALGLGVAGLGLNAALVNQNRTGEQMTAQLGTTPTFVTGGGVAEQLAQLAQQYHLSGTQPQDIAGGLVAGGLNRTDALGPAFAQTAVLVNTFGLSVKDATDLVSRQYVDLNRSAQDVTNTLSGLASVALVTGQPASGLAAILAGAPGLGADLGPAAPGAAAIFRNVFGSNAAATSMAQVASAHGAAAYGLAGMLGMSVDQLDQLRATQQGTGQIADLLAGKARGYVSQAEAAGSTPAQAQETAFEQFNAMLQNAGGQPIDWSAFQKALADQGAGSATARQLKYSISDTYGVAGAQGGVGAVAGGNLAPSAQASNPWNVKDMALNALGAEFGKAGNAFGLLGAGQSGAGAAFADLGADIANAPATLPTKFAQGMGALEAWAGGMAGQGLGNLGGALAGSAPGQAVGAEANAVGGVARQLLELTINLQDNGRTTATTKVTAPLPNSDQAYKQYVPVQRRGSQ